MTSIASICNRAVASTTRDTTVAPDGRPVGIVTADNLLETVADELNELATIVAREQAREAATRR